MSWPHGMKAFGKSWQSARGIFEKIHIAPGSKAASKRKAQPAKAALQMSFWKNVSNSSASHVAPSSVLAQQAPPPTNTASDLVPYASGSQRPKQTVRRTEAAG